ncbi:MAG: SOS response-associated peptidase [Parvularculaceae bacterium]
MAPAFALVSPVMCGRFYLKTAPAEVAQQMGADIRDNFPPRYNIFPSQPVGAIRIGERRGKEGRGREYALMRWGFIPSWAKGDRLKDFAAKPLINARSETVLEKASFKNAFKRRRCLVPADGFYEWQARPAKAKQPYAISKRKSGVFAFAGIWETALDPDGGEINTLAILTTHAGPDVRVIHSREPVVIAPESYKFWLEADERDAMALTAFLAPAPAGFWASHPVSTLVNSPRNDAPKLLDEIDPSALAAEPAKKKSPAASGGAKGTLL